MISKACETVAVIVAGSSEFGAARTGIVGNGSVLTQIDQVVTAASILLALGVVVRKLTRRGTGSLQVGPVPANRVQEDALALAALVYLLSAAVLASLLQIAGVAAESALAQIMVGSGAQLAGSVACLAIAATRFEGGIRGFLLGQRRRHRARADGLASLETPSPQTATGAQEGAGMREADSSRWVSLILVSSVVTIGFCPMILSACMVLIAFVAPEYEPTAHLTIRAIHEPGRSSLILIALWVGAGLIAPVAEELFFRGLLQTYLNNRLRSRWKAVALASLAFGLVHFQHPHAIVALTALGCVLGYAYERTGSLLPPIAIHAAFNLKTLVWDALGTGGGEPAIGGLPWV